MIKVHYIDHMGNDLSVVNSARVSFGVSKTELDEKDKKLINYLAKHDHMSPFEHLSLTIKVECPLYIRSQIHRHRTFSYNEISRRYTEKDMSFFIPETLRKQHKTNRQASEGEVESQKYLLSQINDLHRDALELYNYLLDKGVCKEQARGVLPQNLMTEFYQTGNLRNYIHFIKLRDHEGAQEEVRDMARQVKGIILDKFNYAGSVLLNKGE